MPSLECFRHRDPRPLHRLDLILVFERLVVRGQEIRRRDIPVGLVGDWR